MLRAKASKSAETVVVTPIAPVRSYAAEVYEMNFDMKTALKRVKSPKALPVRSGIYQLIEAYISKTKEINVTVRAGTDSQHMFGYVPSFNNILFVVNVPSNEMEWPKERTQALIAVIQEYMQQVPLYRHGQGGTYVSGHKFKNSISISGESLKMAGFVFPISTVSVIIIRN